MTVSPINFKGLAIKGVKNINGEKALKIEATGEHAIRYADLADVKGDILIKLKGKEVSYTKGSMEFPVCQDGTMIGIRKQKLYQMQGMFDELPQELEKQPLTKNDSYKSFLVAFDKNLSDLGVKEDIDPKLTYAQRFWQFKGKIYTVMNAITNTLNKAD